MINLMLNLQSESELLERRYSSSFSVENQNSFSNFSCCNLYTADLPILGNLQINNHKNACFKYKNKIKYFGLGEEEFIKFNHILCFDIYNNPTSECTIVMASPWDPGSSLQVTQSHLSQLILGRKAF